MKILALQLLFFSFSFNLYATQKFTALNGSNTNPGTLAQPFLTIQFAINQAQPGDTIFIRQGIYFEKLFCAVSGSAAQKITLTNYPGETVNVNGNNIAGLSLLEMNNCSNIEINGLTFENNYLQDAKGIYIIGQGQNISITNCIIKNIGWTNNANADPYSVSPTGQAHGIIINGRTVIGLKNIAVTNCTIKNIVTGNSEALTIAGNVDSFFITKDSVYETKNIGIVAAGNYTWAVNTGVSQALNKARHGQIKNCTVFNNRRINNIDAPAGIYVDGGADIAILNNKAYENGNGISVGCENAGFDAANITVANNIVFNNDNKGIVFGSNAAIIQNCSLFNNTVFKNAVVTPFNSEVGLQNNNNCTIAQNIIIPQNNSIDGIGIYSYTATNLTINNNLIYRFSGSQVNLYVQDPPNQFVVLSGINTNPMFENDILPQPDLRLKINSPAINAGLNIYPAVNDKDAADSFRIVNGRIDLGAFERQDGGCPAIFTLGNTDILQGKFIARDKIIYNRSLNAVTNTNLFFYAPLLEVNQSVEINRFFLVNNVGCF